LTRALESHSIFHRDYLISGIVIKKGRLSNLVRKGLLRDSVTFSLCVHFDSSLHRNKLLKVKLFYNHRSYFFRFIL